MASKMAVETEAKTRGVQQKKDQESVEEVVNKLTATEWSLAKELTKGNLYANTIVLKLLSTKLSKKTKKSEGSKEKNKKDQQVLATLFCLKRRGQEICEWFENSFHGNYERCRRFLEDQAESYIDEMKKAGEKKEAEVTQINKKCQKILVTIKEYIKTKIQSMNNESISTVILYKLVRSGLTGRKLIELFQSFCLNDILTLIDFINEEFRNTCKFDTMFSVYSMIKSNGISDEDLKKTILMELEYKDITQEQDVVDSSNGEDDDGEDDVIKEKPVTQEEQKKISLNILSPLLITWLRFIRSQDGLNDACNILINKLYICKIKGDNIVSILEDCESDIGKFINYIDLKYYELRKERIIKSAANRIANIVTELPSSTDIVGKNPKGAIVRKTHKEICEIVDEIFHRDYPKKSAGELLCLTFLLTAVTTENFCFIVQSCRQAHEFAKKESYCKRIYYELYETPHNFDLLDIKKAMATYILTCTGTELRCLQKFSLAIEDKYTRYSSGDNENDK